MHFLEEASRVEPELDLPWVQRLYQEYLDFCKAEEERGEESLVELFLNSCWDIRSKAAATRSVPQLTVTSGTGLKLASHVWSRPVPFKPVYMMTEPRSAHEGRPGFSMAGSV